MTPTLRVIALLLALACGLPATAAAAGPDGTRTALARQMAWAGPAAGALAVDLDSGRELFALRAETRYVPASVEKLYTTATALTLFGTEARLMTRTLGDAPIEPAGLLPGNLYLRGGGDPTFGAAQAGELADELIATTGLKLLSGRIVGDESVFDVLRGPPSSSYLISRDVGPLSALTFNRGRTGRRRPYFQAAPSLYAAQAFERALERRGVIIGATARRGRAPRTAVALAEWPSPTMAQLALRTNRPSDNFLAETLLKVLGAEFGNRGSTGAGAAVVRRTLAGFGLAPQVVDGSGLSRDNRTSPRQVVRLLVRMADSEATSAFEESLSVMGRTGTLIDRLRRSPARDRCRGKTGTLQGVSALAGYCETTGGGRVAFAFLMNGVSIYTARRLQDRMTDALARYEP